MDTRQGWLFPVMVVAAVSVVAFGGIGIAAITGHLPLAGEGGNALIQYPLVTDPAPSPTAEPIVGPVVADMRTARAADPLSRAASLDGPDLARLAAALGQVQSE